MVRRWRKVAGALVIVVGLPVAALVLLLGWTFSGLPPIPDGRELPGGAVVVKDGSVAAHLIPLPDGKAALVDAGDDPEGAAIRAALEARGLTEDDVVAVLITHGHRGHTAACYRYVNAAVYASMAELALLDGTVAPKGPLPRLFRASRSWCRDPGGVVDGQVVDLGGVEARAYLVPGHTQGSTAWLVRGVLFLGDAADATTDGRLVAARWLYTDDVEESGRSLVTLADRLQRDQEPVQALAFAHSGVLDSVAPLTAFAAAER